MSPREVEDHHDKPGAVTYHDEKKGDTVADVHVVNPNTFDYNEKEDFIDFGHTLQATGEDLAIAEEKISSMSLQQCQIIMRQMRKLHRHDQNFPADTLEQMDKLLDDPDVTANPERHGALIHAMKLEAILSTDNSPYVEVRAVVDPTDDPELPSLTFRVWFIGIIFSGIGAFINQLFDPRQPSVSIGSSTAQLIAYPFGKFLERSLPTKTYSIFGRRFSLNPGPFNKKEHMLITVMCTMGFSTPYTQLIVFIQALPVFYNQPYAYSYGYQLLNTLGMNFLGYGLAGLCRPFTVYPSFCIWPELFPTLALNQAFHIEGNPPVPGPFKRMYTWSRYKFFMVAFIAMFIYFWFPNFIFQALSYFSWITWIAPDNVALTAICGSVNGLGFNPVPTFDWNIFPGGALTTPIFSLVTQMIGMLFSGMMIIIFWWTNAYNTAYLPINSNRTYDNTGKSYKVQKVLDSKGQFDFAKFNQYSEPWMSAGKLVLYFWFFAAYTAMLTYSALYHRHDIAKSFRLATNIFKKRFGRLSAEAEEEQALTEDVHFRLMQKYSEVPEWWYLVVLAIAFGFGIAGVAAYPTNTTPAVVVYGIIIAVIFTIPCGIIRSVTGVPVSMNVLAEFIGGSLTPGNAISMCYFKAYGVETSLNALSFCRDLKLAHYTHINPVHTFITQIVGTLISSFVCTSVFNFIMGFDKICTPEAAFKFKCPSENTFFTAAVFWGTINPKRVFGEGSHFKTLLIGFPAGIVLTLFGFALTKLFPKNKTLRAFHPVAFCYGALQWAPYNLMYCWPTLVVTWFSFKVIRPRWLAFWSKFNYIIPAAFSCGIAISMIVQFFGLAIPEMELDWWGNRVTSLGCEGTPCPLLPIPEKGYFGPDPGTFH